MKWIIKIGDSSSYFTYYFKLDWNVVFNIEEGFISNPIQFSLRTIDHLNVLFSFFPWGYSFIKICSIISVLKYFDLKDIISKGKCLSEF